MGSCVLGLQPSAAAAMHDDFDEPSFDDLHDSGGCGAMFDDDEWDMLAQVPVAVVTF